jgi:transcription elongation GreA/GreB family factor
VEILLMETNRNLKQQLFKHCADYISRNIDINSQAVDAAQSAVVGEDKNTAGDRYETERAMKQRETEMFGQRLIEAEKQRDLLKKIDITKKYNSVQPGALVSTSIGFFFIAISVDEITIDGEVYDIISPQSPLAVAMSGRVTGDSFMFRNKNVKIQDVC